MNVGLETHVELNTKTKIYCSCKVEYGAKPNTRCCPICTGMPGVLPVLNSKVTDYAVMAGLALNCHINNISYMSRKNYIYPDLPKAYQITQNRIPLCSNGYVTTDDKKIRINRIHIEEDAGKTIRSGNDVYVDYNRAGVPLIEIVTEPDFDNAIQVREYLEYIRLTMKHLGISDCRMQEGSLRCDVNISVKSANSQKTGIKCEIKNLNSINNIVNAINSEYQRQVSLLESGQEIKPATLRYDDKTNTTVIMRYKESSAEYRYFDDPDIPPVIIDNEKINSIRASMPQQVSEIKDILESKYLLSSEDASRLLGYPKAVGLFFEIAEKTKEISIAYETVSICLYKYFSTENEREDFLLPIANSSVIEVANLVKTKVIPQRKFIKILDEMLKKKKEFHSLYTEDDFRDIDLDELNDICRNVIHDNQDIVSDYLRGKNKAFAPLMGKVMCKTNGRAEPSLTEEILKEIIRSTEGDK